MSELQKAKIAEVEKAKMAKMKIPELLDYVDCSNPQVYVLSYLVKGLVKDLEKLYLASKEQLEKSLSLALEEDVTISFPDK